MTTGSLNPLSEFAANTYSQFGEDGIVAECLLRISKVVELDRWCAEFGAWDGVHLSNTCRLIREDGYSAVLVEGDPDRFMDLERNLPEHRVKKILCWVSLEGDDRLDAILAETAIPADFDLLSIDIDSCDWHVWNSLEAYRPKVVCVEFNPTISNAYPYVQEPDFSIKHGNGPRARWDLSAQQGYVAVAGTTTNLIFVSAKYADTVLGKSRPSLDALRPGGETVAYVFSGYNGEVLLNPSIQLLWHGMSIGPRRLQILPRALHVFPDDYTPIQRSWFRPARLRWKLRRWRH